MFIYVHNTIKLEIKYQNKTIGEKAYLFPGISPESSMIHGTRSSRMLCTVTPSFRMTMKTSAFIRVAYRSPDHMNNKQLRK